MNSRIDEIKPNQSTASLSEEMLRDMLKRLKAAPPAQRAPAIANTMVTIKNCLAIPMGGSTLQAPDIEAINRVTTEQALLVDELSATIQNKEIPSPSNPTQQPENIRKLNKAHIYYVNFFATASVAASAVTLYENPATKEIYVLLTENKTYKGEFLLPSGYRDVHPPHILPNIPLENGMHIGRPVFNRQQQVVGWEQSYQGIELRDKGKEALLSMSKAAGGSAKVNLRDYEAYEKALATPSSALPGFHINVDTVTKKSAARELQEETGLHLADYKHDPAYFDKEIPTGELPVGANPGRPQLDERSTVYSLGQQIVPPCLDTTKDPSSLTISAQWVSLSNIVATIDGYQVSSHGNKPLMLAHRHLLEDGLRLFWEKKLQTASRVGKHSLIHNIDSLLAAIESYDLSYYPDLQWLVNELEKSSLDNNKFFTYTNQTVMHAAVAAAQSHRQLHSISAMNNAVKLALEELKDQTVQLQKAKALTELIKPRLAAGITFYKELAQKSEIRKPYNEANDQRITTMVDSYLIGSLKIR